MLFAVFWACQHSGISAIEFDLLNPARKSLESITSHKAKSCCSFVARVKIEEWVIGALLLPSSPWQNHELMIDHIMKLSAF